MIEKSLRKKKDNTKEIVVKLEAEVQKELLIQVIEEA
jgi:hypothetical protein